MTKILIDTCIWLDLAKTVKGEEILTLLERFIEEDKATLILPEIIIQEFNRNKDRIVADAGRSLSGQFSKVKDMIKLHAGPDEKDNLLAQLENINYKIPSLGESAFESIKRIEILFKKSEKIQMSDDIKLRSVQRAIDKKAPFHLAKNSIGDSLIIESYADYKFKNVSQEFRLMFVTYNKNDFSIKDGNQKKPHKDLVSLFDSPKSQYFIDLPEALNSIDPDLIEELEFEKEWDWEPRTFSELLEMENELEQKIWYNRHQNRAYHIKVGNTKLVDKKDFDGNYSNDVILKHIWQGALKSAKKVEKKYGKKNLSWDDFEWGMLNGKLSTLRWVMGDEWDNLDT